VFLCNRCAGEAVVALVGDRPSVTERLEHSQAQSPPLYCTFCGKQSSEVKRLVSRKGACICDECLLLGLNILLEGEAPFNGSVPF
jgi:hypothetical protein